MSSTIAFVLLLVACFQVDYTRGFDCSLGTSKNIIEKTINSCPLPLQSPDKSYCCFNLDDNSHYCCTAEEFAVKTGLTLIVPVVIVVAVIIFLITCCISCLCCSCCPWYRRRQGTVYGKVQTPSVVHVIQTSSNAPPHYVTQPLQNSQNQYTPYPTTASGMPQPQQTHEAYVKQAPYNPNYTQQ